MNNAKFTNSGCCTYTTILVIIVIVVLVLAF